MGSSQVIQWDVDGVLADFRGAWRSLIKTMFDIDVPLGETSWDALYAPTGGPHAKLTNAAWEHIRQSKTFWHEVPALATQDELERINELGMSGYTHYFVTSRPGANAQYLTHRWLIEKCSYDIYNFTPTVIISGRKADAANALDAAYVIDDKPGNVLAVYYQSPPDRKVYIRDHSFNRFDPAMVGRRIRRVATVEEFLDDVEAGR